MNTQKLRLDVSKDTIVQQPIIIAQGDKSGTTISATVYDNGTLVTQSGLSARFKMRLPDGRHFYSKVASWSYSSGTVSVTIDETQAASVPGTTHEAYFELLSGSSVIYSTSRFTVRILRSATDMGTSADSYDDRVQELLDDLGSLPTPSTSAPLADGIANAGSSHQYARADHRHPTDTTRASQSDLSSHTGDTATHVSAQDRVNWNSKTDNVGTLTGITTTSPLTGSGTSGSVTIGHANSGVAPGSKGDTSNLAPAFGATFKVPSGKVNATGHLEAFDEHTVTIPSTEASQSERGLMSAADKKKLDGIAGGATSNQAGSAAPVMDGTASVGTSDKYAREDHRHPSDSTRLAVSLKGAANGVAELDASGKVPSSQLAGYGLAIAGRRLSLVEGGVQTAVDLPLAILEYDSDTGCYTNESVSAWLASQADGRAYGVSVPKSASVTCTKTGANAGIAVPTPGTLATPAVDPYVGLGPFVHYDVNGYVDEDGTPHVTAIEGDGRFARDGSNGDVWVLCPTLWWAFDADGEDAVELSVSDTQLAGMSAQPQAYLPDGTLRPYMLYAKYAGVKGEDGYVHSYSGRPIWNRSVSHNSLITQCRTAGTGYSAKNCADMWYVQVMHLMKYATKNAQTYLAGCTSYNYQYAPAVAETNVERVILTKAQAANLLVGSSVMLGSHTGATSNDRNYAQNYDVFDGARIVRIEEYNSTLSAVYIDVESPFDTETSQLFSTAPWSTGTCDGIEGDGSPTNCMNGKEPYVIQGIECALGMYEILGNVIISNDGTTGWVPHVNHDSRSEATSVTGSYASCGVPLPTDENDSWKYPLYAVCKEGLWYGTTTGGSQTTGLCDGHYTNKLTTTGLREWLSGGNLRNGGGAGPWCVIGSIGPTGASWDIGARLSALGRSRG